jgi:outer membrane protein assembly factor BamB
MMPRSAKPSYSILRLLYVSLALAVLLPGSVWAAKVKVWSHHAPAHYDKAQLKQAVVSSEGVLRLSRQLKPLAGIDAVHVWDVVEDRDGNLFVATGDEGKVFKVTADGKASVVFTSDDSQVLCLAVSPDGAVYAGTGPGGHVVRIEPKGGAKVIGDLPDAYIWSLAVDPKGQFLYAGTGPKGRIHRVTPDGKSTVFYTTKQEHIHCLALAADGTLYAGTDKAGLVYRIDPKGKGFVLFSAPQSEVRSLLVTADGVYAATSSPTRRRPGAGASVSGSTSPSGPSGNATSTPVLAVFGKEPGNTDTATPAGNPSAPPSEAKESKATPAPAPSTPGSGENSLYRINPDGTVREIFREKAMLLSLLRQGGRLFVGTGMDGQLFEVDEASHERSETARLDHGQILCMCRRADGSIVLGTGDPGKLYILQDRYAARGSVVSEVLDAKIISKWGALRWKAETPAGTAVTLAVRSGNIAEPDETWSDWSAEQGDPQQGVAGAPAARFLQYRVTLTSDNAAVTPSLQSLTLRYLTTNQAPEIAKIEVPDLESGSLEEPKKLKFKWTATDPNEDELTYSVFVRKDGWKSWVLLEDSLARPEYEWDTTTTPSGTYELKVLASDRKDNPAEDTLSGERVSAPFVVSHTPPVVTVKVVGMDGDQAIVEATATDPLARLTTASFAVNGKKWVNVFPADGLFDARSEKFQFKTEALRPGTYVLVLRVKDAAGNTGSGDVVFTVQTRAAQK